MRHVFFLFLIILFLSSTPARAVGWLKKDSDTTRTLYGMDFADSSRMVAVGASGTVVRSSNTGKDWTAANSGVTTTLTAVSMATSSIGLAVGDSGTILKTTNGGSSWSSITGISTENLNDVVMISSLIAYIAGEDGHVYKTTDGGTTWSDIGDIDGLDVYSIDATSSSVVYVAGRAGGLYRTTDGGANWSALSSGVTVNLNAIDAVNSNTIYVGGDDRMLLKTTDGTTFTNTLLSDFGPTEDVVALRCPTTSVCIAAGNIGAVMSSNDGASTWTRQYTGATGNIYAIATVTSLVWLTAGSDGEMFYYDQFGPEGVSNLAISGGSPTTDTTPTITWDDALDTQGAEISVYEVSANGGTSWTNVGDVNTYTFSALDAGTYTFVVRATDEFDNVGDNASLTVEIQATESDSSGASSADTTAPTVGGITPSTALSGVLTTLNATYSDDVGVVSCTLYLDGADAGTMALSSGIASDTETAPTAGTYFVYATCTDAAGNIGTGSTTTVTVSDLNSIDASGPTISSITPIVATVDTAVTLSATVTDTTGVNGCRLYVNGSDQGAMTASGSTYSRSYTFTNSGTGTAYALCTDTLGNATIGTSATITVASSSSTSSTDTVAPTVGAVSPSAATVGTAVTLSVSVDDSGEVDGCTLYVNDTPVGAMTESSGFAIYSYTFADAGTAAAYAICEDVDSNITTGASTIITVSAASSGSSGSGTSSTSDEEDEAVDEADETSLIKMACSGETGVNDPCRAVYYYGEDGKRHAFPNEKVFFTWFEDFDDLVIVTDELMASLSLGGNVTYHPGTKMVKFISVNTVYAVGEEGELRAIGSEDVASDLYGTDWNQQIDDISDAFFGNYSFGDEIEELRDYDPEQTEESVETIDEIL